MNLSKEQFGTTANGARVDLFTLSNDRGMEVKIINYGGIITSISVPDRIGNVDDVVLGHDTLEGYLNRSRYFGALIGRHANRIAGAKFPLNGEVYSLAKNNGENHIHGGIQGFDKVIWEAKAISGPGEIGLELEYLSKDGEEGYPGNLRAKVTYILTENNELRMEYFSDTDKDTVVNLTNHSYFNLAGAGTVLGHELQLDADHFTPVRKGLIPIGELRSVRNTPLDFTRSSAIGARIEQSYEQLECAGGYDHNFILRRNGNGLTRAAKLYEPVSGRVMEVLTTQPGMQFYSGNFLDGSITGKGGRVYGRHAGCCFETQHFPDAPNQPSFPTTILKRGQRYEHTTVFRFSVE